MKIRNIKSNDSNDLFIWRNDIKTRRCSLNEKSISLEEHQEWFANALKNKHIDFLICEIDHKKVGVCRFDVNKLNNQAEISININPDYRGKGFGKKFLILAINKFLKKTFLIFLANQFLNSDCDFCVFL